MKKHIAISIRDKLLELCSKTMRRDFPKIKPCFCTGCINKVKVLFPELCMGEEEEPNKVLSVQLKQEHAVLKSYPMINTKKLFIHNQLYRVI